MPPPVLRPRLPKPTPLPRPGQRAPTAQRIDEKITFCSQYFVWCCGNAVVPVVWCGGYIRCELSYMAVWLLSFRVLGFDPSCRYSPSYRRATPASRSTKTHCGSCTCSSVSSCPCICTGPTMQCSQRWIRQRNACDDGSENTMDATRSRGICDAASGRGSSPTAAEYASRPRKARPP